MTNEELTELAKKASENSYSPYSHFRVGAALECADGTVFTGCNVENSSYGATCCAERTALFSAAAKGYRKFTKIAIVGTSDGNFSEMTYPCGVCRQVLSEFCSGDFSVVVTDDSGVHCVKFSELFPHPFLL
ncbi:MAG: cytidine deaminase [Clostridia bacterium]|nr:cytidine deaminase [Clostridia bacterium]